jgi:hypothetical protein
MQADEHDWNFYGVFLAFKKGDLIKRPLVTSAMLGYLENQPVAFRKLKRGLTISTSLIPRNKLVRYARLFVELSKQGVENFGASFDIENQSRG